MAITLTKLLRFGMELHESADAPRFDGFQLGQTFWVETRVPDQVRQRVGFVEWVSEPAGRDLARRLSWFESLIG